MDKGELFDITIGKIMCLCNNHDKITYYPRGDAKTADVEVILCRRCAKELSRRKLKGKR